MPPWLPRERPWFAPTSRLRAHRAPAALVHGTLCAVQTFPPDWNPFMKIILWIIFIIFLIGLAVVLGLGKLIF